MKFILLYRGKFGNTSFQVFETREEANSCAQTDSMKDKEIFGVFELDSPVSIPPFFS